MKIALSTSVIQRGRTGIAQYVFALVRALLPYADRHEFSLLVLAEDAPLFDFARGAMRIVTVEERFRPAVRNIVWHQRDLPRLARREGWDVLHVPSYRRLVWSRPCPRVATIHDLAPFHVTGKYDVARMFYGRVVVRRLARRQDAVIAISENTARDIDRFFQVPRERMRVIHNGLDHERFRPGPPEVAQALARGRFGLDRPYLLYISRLEHPAKNHVRLIQAFERFKERTGSPCLLALGGSDWHGAEAIHAAAKASPIAADIRFLGFIADADLPDLYRAAHAFVYPSVYEGFGFPPVEAMACDCPVVSTTRGALVETVGDAARTIEPDDVEGMAAALAEVSGDEALRARLREAGRRNARRFDWARNARDVLAVYESVAGGARRQSSPAGRVIP